jgi:hypothetical protein
MPASKTLAVSLALLGALLFDLGDASDYRLPRGSAGAFQHPAATLEDRAVIEAYCLRCHDDARRRGNLSLEGFDPSAPERDPVTAEKVIVKLRAGMMPPPGVSRPAGDTLDALVRAIEQRVDAVAAANPNPGTRTFQRLNRAEYERSVEALLGLRVDAANYLPPDTKSENFDNIADAQLMSPLLLDAYLNAAAEIARLAVGDAAAEPARVTYAVSGYRSQTGRVDGAPFGTRGGVVVEHVFPADGEYAFSLVFEHTTTGDGFAGQLARGEQVELSVDGERVALLDVDAWMSYADSWGITMRTPPVHVRAGPHRVAAAFVRTAEGPVEDLLSPHDWSIADRHTGMSAYGLTLLPHLRELEIAGPSSVTGVSSTPVRDRIFTCRPTTPVEERACAERIVTDLAGRAYRRPVTARDRAALVRFWEQGAAEGGFEVGVRTSLQAVLASPHFLFRIEEAPAGVGPGEAYRISDLALASRLSYFLWARPPDDELLGLAAADRLSEPEVLRSQVRRMLADERSSALGTRFAAQWLRLQDLDKVHPDSYWFPDFDQQLADAMRTETELLFTHLVRDDGGVLDLYDAEYTYANERLARHYGIPDVVGQEFRRVAYPDDRRAGLLGHGSILTLTSHGNRTSPVLRGKWVMEVLMGTPPPPPPPGVPDLEETDGALDGRPLTTRERMELHRANPTCASCHRFIDPIGLALDNFDVTGRWRIRENGTPLDTRGELYDGTPVETPEQLRKALLRRPEPLLRTFTQNLMAYALGRRVEHFDQPTVRRIVREAEADGYRVSAFVIGVVESDAFQMQRAVTARPDGAGGAGQR